MDRLADYRTLLKQSLSEFAAWVNQGATEDSELICVFDEERDYYMVVRVEWGQYRCVQGAQIFARIRNGKIWIEEDWTEKGIATELIRADVPQEDIVLGFQPADLRHLSEFAAVP